MKKMSKAKENKLVKFAEELSWLMDAYKEFSLGDILERFIQSSKNNSEQMHGLYSNTSYLVGVLPRMFQDKELFENNSDLASFAKDVLHIELKNSEKKSRMEIIGTIVCNISNDNSELLDTLVKALESIMDNESKMAEVKKSRKQPNFSWNAIIASFSKGE
jgi:hypothetical protein